MKTPALHSDLLSLKLFKHNFLAIVLGGKKISAVVVACATMTVAQDEVLVGWNFNTFQVDNTSFTVPISPHIQATDIITTDLSLGPGLREFLARPNPIDSSTGMRFVNELGANSPNTAFSNGTFASFTLAAAAGYMMSVTSLTLDAWSPGSIERNFFVFYSTDGFVDNSTELIAPTSTTITGISVLGNVNLTDVTVPIEFRIYGYAPNDRFTANRAMNFDNIIVNGTVMPIPEPAGLTLLGLGSALLLTRRRRSTGRMNG
jgi:hypothetical protein